MVCLWVDFVLKQNNKIFEALDFHDFKKVLSKWFCSLKDQYWEQMNVLGKVGKKTSCMNTSEKNMDNKHQILFPPSQ